tara:strand:+ start:1081 stop:1605 length:525 start_codon:yes stop_codon:yes gene_type:complete
VVDLIAKTPCGGLLPVTIGQTALSEITIDYAWSVAPFDGRMDATTAALKKLGLTLPETGRFTATEMAQMIWFGHGQYLVLGVPDLPPLPAAVTGQSDGWACVRIDGAARDLLARLAPVDLRDFDGQVLRTLVGHMSAVLIGRAGGVVDVMVMRSMAQTLVHELTTAAKAVAARG